MRDWREKRVKGSFPDSILCTFISHSFQVLFSKPFSVHDLSKRSQRRDFLTKKTLFQDSIREQIMRKEFNRRKEKGSLSLVLGFRRLLSFSTDVCRSVSVKAVFESKGVDDPSQERVTSSRSLEETILQQIQVNTWETEQGNPKRSLFEQMETVVTTHVFVQLLFFADYSGQDTDFTVIEKEWPNKFVYPSCQYFVSLSVSWIQFCLFHRLCNINQWTEEARKQMFEHEQHIWKRKTRNESIAILLLLSRRVKKKGLWGGRFVHR